VVVPQNSKRKNLESKTKFAALCPALLLGRSRITSVTPSHCFVLHVIGIRTCETTEIHVDGLGFYQVPSGPKWASMLSTNAR
ncbi:MAG: hypothetical protein WA785_23700, partial [Candidatus Acidiferrales bacterium]